MSLTSKLTRWRDAGLIDEATRARIEAFEQGERKPVVLYALGVLGGGTVALGIVSIVAANWEAIPGGVKLACDLALGLALAVATFFSVERASRFTTEVLVTLFYGFTLASLALVGQVYQLGTPTWQGLLVWSAATLPLILLGQSRYLAALVGVGLATTHGFALEALFDHLEHGAGLSADAARNTIAACAFVSPLLYVPLARVPWLVRERPEYARTLATLAFAAVLLAGFALQFVWYDDVRADDTLTWALAVTALSALALGAALPRLYPEASARGRGALAAILGFGWLTLAVGTAVPHAELELVGALLQLLWLGLFAWAALQLGRLRLFNTLTALIALRVLVVYFEVFGSLLSTGVGLISGGVLTLLMAWLWRRKTRDLGARLGPKSPLAGQAGGGDVA